MPAAVSASFAVAHHHSFVTIVEAVVVSKLAFPSDLLIQSDTCASCADDLFLMYVSGISLITFVALPIPTHSPFCPIGRIGSVLKTFFPKDSIPPPIFSPKVLDFIAAKTTIHINPIAKKLTISRENQSKPSHRGSLVNSN